MNVRSWILIVAAVSFSACAPPTPRKASGSLPVRWTSAVKLKSLDDIQAALDRPVPMQAGESLVLHEDGNKARTVTTGREWLKALKDGYSEESTYDITMESYFIHNTATLLLLGRAHPSTVSYVADLKLGKDAAAVLPCTIHPRWNEYVEVALDSGRKFPDLPGNWKKIADAWDFQGCGDSSPRYAALFPAAVVSNVTPFEVEVYDSGVPEEAVQTTLEIVGWGDWDGDGIEDVLLRQSTYYNSGSGRSYDHMILTRLKRGDALVVRRVPSVLK